MKKFQSFFMISMLAIQAGSSQNVGIGTSNPYRAKLEIHGLAGNTAAIFGGGNGETGISLVANIPGIYFNSYYNNGIKSLSQGPVGLISLNNSSQLQFDLSIYWAQTPNEPVTTTATKLLIDPNGKVAVNMPAISSRAMFEQQGAISVNSAIFGGDGKGVSLQKDWPAIGLNHYFTNNHLSIGGGYGAQIGVNQNTGALYFAQFSNSAPLANGLLLNPISAINFKYGKIGVNTDDPQAALHIHDIETTNSTRGIRFSSAQVPSVYWNLFSTGGLFFCKNGSQLASVSAVDGAWLTYSDQRLKKNIVSYDENVVDKLLQLHTSKYQMKNESDESSIRHIGFMAQELQSVFPEVVTEDEKGMKMVNYAGLVPMLTKAIQEQQKLIEKQQQQIEWLMKKVQ